MFGGPRGVLGLGLRASGSPGLLSMVLGPVTPFGVA